MAYFFREINIDINGGEYHERMDGMDNYCGMCIFCSIPAGKLHGCYYVEKLGCEKDQHVLEIQSHV